jgi:hypothetical protein
MRFEQRGVLKARDVTQARAVREVLRADLPPSLARDLSDRQWFDFDPLASEGVPHRSIPTQRLLVCSRRRLGRFLPEPLHLCFPHRKCCLPGG